MNGSVCWFCLGLTLWAGVIWAQERTPKTTTRSAEKDQNTIAEFRVARSGDLLLIPVMIGDAEHQFLLDTGAMSTVLSNSLAEKLAPLKRSSRSYPKGLAQRYELPDAQLAGTNVRITGDGTKLDLADLSRMSGYDIAGILGMSFLDGHVIELDFDAGVVSFLASLPKNKTPTIPITRDELNRPTISIDIAADKSVPFLIDTGMAIPGVGEMTSALFDELLEVERLTLVGPKAKTLTVAGVIGNRKAQLDIFKIGDSKHQNLRVNEGNLNGLGLDYLSRYKVTLDLTNNQAFFEPGKRFAESPIFDASGIIVLRIDGKTVVERVHPDGPAFAAGVRAGDELTHLNGHLVKDHSLFVLRRALSRPEKTVTFSAQRLGEDRICKFVLKNWQKGILE